MITRHHLALSLICGLFPCIALGGSDSGILLSMLAGMGLGAILPDIHMKRPAKTRLLTGAWYLVQTGRKTVIPLMCRLLSLFWGIQTSHDNKRLTHSLPGIALFAVLYTSPVLAVSILLSGHYIGFALVAFSAGIFLGMIVHLVQDLCTRKGIVPLYPLSAMTVHGSIRPCDVHDPRIPQFHIQHVLILFLFQIALLLDILPDPATLSCGFLCVALCIVSMIWQSEVKVNRDAGLPSLVDDGVAG